MRRDVYQAIADPVRRQIIGKIAYGPLSLNTLAGNFSISRPAVSRHIKILAQCGLVEVKKKGRERYCQAKLQQLSVVDRWLAEYRAFWAMKLNSLEDFLTRESPAKKVTRKNKR